MCNTPHTRPTIFLTGLVQLSDPGERIWSLQPQKTFRKPGSKAVWCVCVCLQAVLCFSQGCFGFRALQETLFLPPFALSVSLCSSLLQVRIIFLLCESMVWNTTLKAAPVKGVLVQTYIKLSKLNIVCVCEFLHEGYPFSVDVVYDQYSLWNWNTQIGRASCRERV